MKGPDSSLSCQGELSPVWSLSITLGQRREQPRKMQCMSLESLRGLQSMDPNSGLCLSKPQNIYRVLQASSCLPPISTAVCYRYPRVEIKSQLLGPNLWLRTIAQIDSDCFPIVSERRKQPTSSQGITSVRDTVWVY